jgi:FkbM family methyltransferase
MSEKLLSTISSNFKNILRKIVRFPASAQEITDFSQEFRQISFAQSGEDLIIDYIFKLRGISHPSYIDIGANHPFYLSNTAHFYLKGCRGINVEANPNLIIDFTKFRDKDINLNCGVGVREEKLDFFIISDPTLSTFSQPEAEAVTKTGKYSIVENKKIKTYTIEHLLKTYCQGNLPDFLSIDVEGFDFEIIKTIDFDFYKPKVICVESHNYSPIGAGTKREYLIDYIVSKNYHEYADTGLNSILVEKSFWFV